GLAEPGPMLAGAYPAEDLDATLVDCSGLAPAVPFQLGHVQAPSTEFTDITPTTPSGSELAIPPRTRPSGVMSHRLPTSMPGPTTTLAFPGRLSGAPTTRGSKLQDVSLDLPNQRDLRIVLRTEASRCGQ